MLGTRLQDRHCYAMGVAARHIGVWTDAYRPSEAGGPLRPQNRFLKLPALFMPAGGSDKRSNLPGDPFWHGIFDASYTQVGDYLVGPAGMYFIGSQMPLLPVLCVRTNRTLSISRPSAQSVASVNAYGGYSPASAMIVLTGWPASMIMNSRYGEPEVLLPTNQPAGYLSILLPATRHVVLEEGDLIEDDLGHTSVLVASELSDFGWRLVAKPVTT